MSDLTKTIELLKGRRGGDMPSETAEFVSSDARIYVPATKVSVVDTSGAGDVLAGSFLSYISLGISNKTALEKSVKLASVAITEFGVDHLVNLLSHNSQLV